MSNNTKFLNSSFKKFILLGTVSVGLLYGIDAKAELRVTKGTYSALTPSVSGEYRLAEANKTNTFTALQTFGELTFSTEGSAIANTIATSISSSSTDNELITAKGVYDYLDNAGIADMSIYAKIADVYTKEESDAKYLTYHQDISGKANAADVYNKSEVYTKDEADGKFLTSHQDISGKANVGDSYTKEESDAKYLTSHQDISGKANIGDSYTKDESDAKYLTSHQDISGKANVGDSYTKDESDAKYLTSHQDISGKANVGDSYTKAESDAKYLTSHQDISGKANVGDSYTKDESDAKYLTSHQDISGKANVGDSYTKDESDAKYATQIAISDMLTKTEAGNTYATQSALNDYKTSNDNAVSALTGKMTQAETDISGIKGSAVMSSGITAEKVAAYEGYAALIDAKQDALTTEQMAVLNSGITAADIATVQTANARLDAMDTTVADLSADFGDVADFSNSKTGNLKNDVPSSSKPNATTVTKAIANMDATIGQIHGLAAKVGVENGGANLGQNTTVEEHLTSLAGSIGNRTHYTQQNYIKNNQTVAQSLDNLDIAVGSIRRDFASAQIANEARFNDIEHNINHLENKMEKGLAANNALAALKPLSSTYKTQLSAAMGGYENNQAFAIGGFHYVTEKVLLNTGVAYGGNNSMSYNVGVTFGF